MPTTLEAGYADSDYTFWVGAFAPAKTPREIVEKLNREMAKAVQAPAVHDKLAKLGVEPMAMTPTEFDARVKEGDRRLWRLRQGRRPEDELAGTR